MILPFIASLNVILLFSSAAIFCPEPCRASGRSEFSAESDLTLGVSVVKTVERRLLFFPRGLLNFQFPSFGGDLFSGKKAGQGGWIDRMAIDAYLSAEFIGVDAASDGGGTDVNAYRWWIRGSGNGWEGTAGLQKISYGHCRIFRPLALFDNLSFNDITKRTDGIEALKIRLFPTEIDELHGWLIRDSSNFGGRYNRILKFGEAALTFHRRSGDVILPDERIYGLDFFFDIKIGFWGEIVHHDYDLIENSTMWCVGVDYTFEKVGNGLHLGFEHLATRSAASGNSTATTLFWDIPIKAAVHHYGMIFKDSLSGIHGLNLRMVRDAGPATTTELGIQWLSGLSFMMSGPGTSSAGGTASASVGLARAITFRVIRNY